MDMIDIDNIQELKDMAEGKTSIFEGSDLNPDKESMLWEYEHGKPIGDPAHSGNAKMTEIFAWKRSFVYAWTGLPNSGKTQFFSFMALIKSMRDKWKWAFWSPEQLSSEKRSNRVKVNANDIYDDLIFSFKGMTPYKHMAEKYKIPRMSKHEYMEAIEYIRQYFVVLNPPDRRFSTLVDNYRWAYEKYGVDGFLIDPFKNLKDEGTTTTTDRHLDDIFAELKEFAIDTNSVFNIIAHPKADKNYLNGDGSYRVITPRDLLGGAAWHNNMDGIFSLHRPEIHKTPTSPRVEFHTLKMRKQNLVARVGVCDEINFDYKTNRYYFNGRCPIDGHINEEFQETSKLKSYYEKEKDPPF